MEALAERLALALADALRCAEALRAGLVVEDNDSGEPEA